MNQGRRSGESDYMIILYTEIHFQLVQSAPSWWVERFFPAIGAFFLHASGPSRHWLLAWENRLKLVYSTLPGQRLFSGLAGSFSGRMKMGKDWNGNNQSSTTCCQDTSTHTWHFSGIVGCSLILSAIRKWPYSQHKTKHQTTRPCIRPFNIPSHPETLCQRLWHIVYTCAHMYMIVYVCNL